jgi:hypothetical protein
MNRFEEFIREHCFVLNVSSRAVRTSPSGTHLKNPFQKALLDKSIAYLRTSIGQSEMSCSNCLFSRR